MQTPPVLPTTQRPAGSLRVVTGLVVFALLDLSMQAWSAFVWLKNGGSLSLTAPFSTLALGLAAWLVWRGRRGIWRVLLYLAPIGLGLILGLFLAGGLFLPWRLLRALLLHSPQATTLHLVHALLAGLILGWLAWEAGRVQAAGGPRQTWSRAPVLAALGALPTLLLAKLALLLMQGSWTAEAVAQARAELGDAYDYQVISWQVHKQAGRTSGHAVVLAYNDEEVQQVQVRW